MNKILLKIIGTFILVIASINAQNPIIPAGMYIADPEAHVWNDGKLYIYGSRDESDDYWCSYSHHVLSTSDLKNWTNTENAFASKGPFDQVNYHDKLLFAPDVAHKNGTYYLYYCSPGKEFTEGVATSNSPNGPFVNGKQIKGASQIDPAVLIDDDGQGYYYWGQGKPKVAKLKPNLVEIDTSTITFPLDEKGNKAFHEGSSIRKIGNLYYLVFADESRNNTPTCLGYAISKSPMGPFEYKGIIIDNNGCDPSTWNNHGSIEKFKDKWYVFYHRSTNNSQKFRKTCIEPISINPDGTINEVQMTSQGVREPFKQNEIIQAEWACYLSGNARISSVVYSDKPNEGITEIMNNNHAVFKFVTFNKKITHFEAKTMNNDGGEIEIRLDNENGELIGTCKIESTLNNVPYKITKSQLIKEVNGTHAVYLVFKTSEKKTITLDWFKFY